MHKQCFELNFNTKYCRTKKGNQISKDIDIEAYKNGQKIFFEVYTPNNQVDINGFFDLPEFGIKFEKKIKTKEYDKFEGIILNQLNGQLILAVNCTYDERFNIFQTVFDIDLKEIIHKEIDGILLFNHDLIKEESLQIVKFLTC